MTLNTPPSHVCSFTNKALDNLEYDYNHIKRNSDYLDSLYEDACEAINELKQKCEEWEDYCKYIIE